MDASRQTPFRLGGVHFFSMILDMPKGAYKVFTDVISFKVCEEQRVWLENKAIEQTSRLGREVTMTMVLRALIQKQMDYDQQKRKVWDAEVQVPCSVRSA